MVFRIRFRNDAGRRRTVVMLADSFEDAKKKSIDMYGEKLSQIVYQPVDNEKKFGQYTGGKIIPYIPPEKNSDE